MGGSYPSTHLSSCDLTVTMHECCGELPDQLMREVVQLTIVSPPPATTPVSVVSYHRSVGELVPVAPTFLAPVGYRRGVNGVIQSVT